MVISVCIGSSCHLRGSYDIIGLFKEALVKYDLSEKITLNASFCLGKCTTGVSIKVDEQIVTGVSKENFNEIFKEYVLGALK